MNTFDLGSVIGPTGATGATGEQGPEGPQGPQGPQGRLPYDSEMLPVARAAVAELRAVEAMSITEDTTLAALANKRYVVTSIGTEENTLTVTLPASGSDGDEIVVAARAGDATAEMIEEEQSAAWTVKLTVAEAANVALQGGASPAAAWAVIARARFVGGVWCVDFATMSAPDGWDGDNQFSATIVYSGEGWAATSGTSYEQSSSGGSTVALRTDIFRKLYGFAPITGWGLATTDETPTYADGATVSRSGGTTLTLYPLYDLTATYTGSLPAGPSWSGDYTGSASKTVKVTDHIGGYAESKVKVVVEFRVYQNNNAPSGLRYSLDGSNWTLGPTTQNKYESKTLTVTLTATLNANKQFTLYIMHSGNGARDGSATFKGFKIAR